MVRYFQICLCITPTKPVVICTLHDFDKANLLIQLLRASRRAYSATLSSSALASTDIPGLSLEEYFDDNLTRRLPFRTSNLTDSHIIDDTLAKILDREMDIFQINYLDIDKAAPTGAS